MALGYKRSNSSRDDRFIYLRIAVAKLLLSEISFLSRSRNRIVSKGRLAGSLSYQIPLVLLYSCNLETHTSVTRTGS